eukprot:6463406-Amphidinium_carterae.1
MSAAGSSTVGNSDCLLSLCETLFALSCVLQVGCSSLFWKWPVLWFKLMDRTYRYTGVEPDNSFLMLVYQEAIG